MRVDSENKQENRIKNKNTTFGGLWVAITDMDSAVEAAKTTQYVSFYLALSYMLQTGYLIWTGGELFGAYPVTNLELYAVYGTNILAIIISLWFGLRIRNEKFGVVPVVVCWMLFEITMNLLIVPEAGTTLIIVFALLATSGLRGWFAVRCYSKEIGNNP